MPLPLIQAIIYILAAVGAATVFATLVVAIVQFYPHIFNWLKQRMQNMSVQHAFVGLKEKLQKAPVRNVGLKKSLIQGIYDESTDSLTDAQEIRYEDLDRKTKEVLGNESLVILE